MSVPSHRDPKYWQDQAQEALAMAELLNDPAAKSEMLSIAKAYERLAARAQAQADEDKNSN